MTGPGGSGTMSRERTLEELLSRDVAATRVFERHAFDRLSGSREIVLMGAGGLGRRTLAGLRRQGVEPLAFADNSAGLQGTVVDGLPVLSPEAAARRFASRAAFVVTIWGANRPHRFAHSREQLWALGCDVVCPFPLLFWKYPDALLPFYLQDLPSRLLGARAEVRRAFDLWNDDASRAEYVAQVGFRLDADFDGLGPPAPHPQYLPDDLFAWSDHEWIVDGGGFVGDTVRVVVAKFQDRFGHLLAVEPDPRNFAQLEAAVADLAPAVRVKVECCRAALGSERGRVHLESTGTAASMTSVGPSAGTVAVSVETIDSLVGAAKPTFIKLDIEGDELEALEGAQRTIERHAPVLAVCVYHRQDHLWRIPLLLRAWRGDYAFFLRPHNEEGWDLVCYAVPLARLVR